MSIRGNFVKKLTVKFSDDELKILNESLAPKQVTGFINQHLHCEFEGFSMYLFIKDFKVWYKKLDYSKAKSFEINEVTSNNIISFLKENDSKWYNDNLEFLEK